MPRTAAYLNGQKMMTFEPGEHFTLKNSRTSVHFSCGGSSLNLLLTLTMLALLITPSNSAIENPTYIEPPYSNPPPMSLRSMDVLAELRQNYAQNASSLPSSSSSSSMSGVSLHPGPHSHLPAFYFHDVVNDRKAFIRGSQALSKVLNSMGKDIAILTSLKQNSNNAGTILMLTHEGMKHKDNRIFELQSSGHKNVLRLHYRALSPSHSLQDSPSGSSSAYDHSMMAVVLIPLNLADDKWHKLALTLSGNQLEVFLDCKSVLKQVINPLDLRFDPEHFDNLTLWIGQHGHKNHFRYKGFLQNLLLVSGSPHGHVLQCPDAVTSCPTCGEFQNLQQTVQQMREEYQRAIHQLSKKVNEMESRLKEVEECDCRKACRSPGGIIREDGATWGDECQLCSCVKGEITCRPPSCPSLNCTDPNPPVPSKGICCPTCKASCHRFGKVITHGQSFKPQRCAKCTCKGGHLHCDRTNPKRDCPKLTCPKEEQILEEGKCCKVCKADHCSKHDNPCHPKANCINGLFNYSCRCSIGYQGNGYDHCEDVNECQMQGGNHGHHCTNPETVCVNTEGSHECKCKEGYEEVGQAGAQNVKGPLTCKPINPCEVDNLCGLNANCVSSGPGKFECVCKAGYGGDPSSECHAICEEGCYNGGRCMRPNECQCAPGWNGTTCENDVNECESLHLHKCPQNSRCVNKMGWHECDCNEGLMAYQDPHQNDLISCVDIDECQMNSHQCPDGTKCHNTFGGYGCLCTDSTKCNKTCQNENSIWNQNCLVCQCSGGVASCKPKACNCQDPDDVNNGDCCPECQAKSNLQLHHNNLKRSCSRHIQGKLHQYESGRKWVHECQECECFDGEIDCWPLQCPINAKMFNQIPTNPCCISPCVSDISAKNCLVNSLEYGHGESWNLTHIDCTNCRCDDGQVFCATDNTCSSNQD